MPVAIALLNGRQLSQLHINVSSGSRTARSGLQRSLVLTIDTLVMPVVTSRLRRKTNRSAIQRSLVLTADRLVNNTAVVCHSSRQLRIRALAGIGTKPGSAINRWLTSRVWWYQCRYHNPISSIPASTAISCPSRPRYPSP